MKCPYRDFQECIVEQCPSCNYEEEKISVICGRSPHWMSQSEALKRGMLWYEKQTQYKFVSCKLIDNGVQPIPATKQTINNTNKTAVMVRKSIF